MTLQIRLVKNCCFDKYLSQSNISIKKAGFLNLDNFLLKTSLSFIINVWDKIPAIKYILSIKVSEKAILLNS